MPERSFLVSGDCNSESDGSMTRIDREALFLGLTEVISTLQVLIS
jgi:hypothetical protein